ncbi:type VI secretion system Vgr family protein [Massilia sp. CF038]|uniref:type VI secretion system Vgr family protein n=1 Tax=Massilia sp. CF038 TaxID=1881045 RepID=UPI00090F6E81|nr:type VI secretion system tip protein TssI/VgrG [Massilia sp. CF038]SHH10043.1 type VI secretion system secreted protein VgrG [Massilia sp. CF038]
MTTNVVSLSTALGADQLQLSRMHGEEALSELFVYHLELHSADVAIDLQAMVGKAATVSVALADGALRTFNGVVTRFVQTGGSAGSATYRAELRPWLWWLTLDADARIYQRKTVPDIICALFAELGFSGFKNALSGTYAERDYCVQYNESAFDFVSRLMEEEGIFYCFEHEGASHTMVLLDDADHYRPCTGLAQARYQDTSSSRDRLDLVFRCEMEQSAVPGKYASGDFHFKTPAAALSASAEGAGGDTRVYQYPGGYMDAGGGTALASLRMQALAQPSRALRGASTCRAFTAGGKFDLSGHFRDDLNSSYVLRRVAHELSAEDYSNSFEAFPLALPFRAPLRTPKARIVGTQTATVVGKSGEEIWTDEFGRVKVQFHWDQRGKRDEDSSCWIRVAHGSAGLGFGAFFLPRMGQEVLVSFLDGDPDRPIVTGGVYNATQTYPEPLPANQTRSGIRSQSSKGGGGSNELRFEDKKDAEELYLHAQKDMLTLVENDRSCTVAKGNDTMLVEKGNRSCTVGEGNDTLVVSKGNRSCTVGEGNDTLVVSKGNRSCTVTEGNEVLLVEKGTRSVTVEADETHTSKANFTHTVTKNYELKVDGNLTITVTGSLSIKSDKDVAIEAATSMACKAGTTINNSAGTAFENKAGTTMLNDAGVSLTNKGSASQTIDGGGALTIKGGIVKIN